MKTSTTKAPVPLDLNGLSDLASMLAEPAAPSGVAMLFDIDLIEEDPENLRSKYNPGLSDASIAEMTASIKANLAKGGRGVIVPISIHPHPTKPGHFVINHGHRRFRGAKAAGLMKIPAHIDGNHSKDDQFIENIHHEGHTAREIADYIGGKLAEGKSQTQIAAEIGKSKAFVSQYTAMLNLPDPVSQAVQDGRITDVTVANELARAYKDDPAAVEAALSMATNPIGSQAENGEGSLAAKPTFTRSEAKAVREQAGKSGKAKKKPKKIAEKSADFKRVERAMADHLGTTVVLTPGKKETAQLIIKIHSWEHFDGLLQRMGMGNLLNQTDEV